MAAGPEATEASRSRRGRRKSQEVKSICLPDAAKTYVAKASVKRSCFGELDVNTPLYHRVV